MSAANELRPEDSFWNLIAVYLRMERLRRGLSQSQVAEIIQADKQRVANTEAGRLNMTSVQAEQLDEAWGTLFRVLRKYAVTLGRDQEWWKQLIDFETGALIVKSYVSKYIPVPFQTETYARQLLTARRGVRDIEAAVKGRMARSSLLLDQLPKLDLWALIDEEALDPPIPSEAKREQLQVLLDLTERTSVRIIPARTWHIGGEGNFELITTSTGANVGYMWAQLGGRLVHDAPEVRELALRYDRIGAKALTEHGSQELIEQKLERLNEHRVAQEQQIRHG
ncbi:Scr1 family TA system antitoxin-like transcriptional regulator [Actinomadura sp. 1N219]|uniref:Scr1 family TA system antitoxin-like transcriptional regulator n=1 Tax=Actinomadura sp. 1N219 TaxID=3375152 RepID=UPI0037B76D69